MPGLLDEAIKVGKDLEGADQRLRNIQTRIDQAQKRLQETEAEATRKGRKIVQVAMDEAAGILNAAEGTRRTATRLLHEAEAQEKATGWVKEEQRKLANRTNAVNGREKEANRAISEATAEKELYTSHLRAIKETEDALAARERTMGRRAHPSAKKPQKKRGRPKKSR